MINFFDLSKEALEKVVVEAGFPRFKGEQLYHWVYDKMCIDPEKMLNLDKKFKEYITSNFLFLTLKEVVMKKSDDREGGSGGSIKFLLSLEDQKTIEMVIMRYQDKTESKVRNTLCLSSQVGCSIGCPFCATGMEGCERNLTAHEMIEQVFLANQFLKELEGEHSRITNVVFMGMGEPFLNQENVFKTCDALGERFHIGDRRITISTSGYLPGIKAFSDKGRQWVLAISLHGTRDALRDELVPLNKKYPLKELLQACNEYQQRGGRRITFEYIMIHNKNIGTQEVKELGQLLRGVKSHVNGIIINPTAGSPYKRPSQREIAAFREGLEKNKISFSLREEKGSDIEGACGQLKRGDNRQ